MVVESPAEPVDPSFAALCASIRQKLREKDLWFPENDDVGLDAPALERIDRALEETEDLQYGKCIPFGTTTARDRSRVQYLEMELAGLKAYFLRFAKIPCKKAQSLLARAPMAIHPYLPGRSRIAAELFEKDPMLFYCMFA